MAKQKNRSNSKTKKPAQLKSTRPKWLKWKIVVPIVVITALVGGFLTYMSIATSVPDEEVTWRRSYDQLAGGTGKPHKENGDNTFYRVMTDKKPIFTLISTEDMYNTGEVCISIKNLTRASTKITMLLEGGGVAKEDFFYNGAYHPGYKNSHCMHTEDFNTGAKLTIKIAKEPRVSGDKIGVSQIFGRVYECRLSASSTDPGQIVQGYKDSKPYTIRVCGVPGSTSYGEEDLALRPPGQDRANARVNGKYFNQWKDLLKQALNDGIRIVANSSFRSNQKQEQLRRDNCSGHVYTQPPKPCDPATAIPGTSNHQYGAAVDIDIVEGPNNDPSLTACKNSVNPKHEDYSPGKYPVYEWLAANAPKYGIDATVESECWHWEALN